MKILRPHPLRDAILAHLTENPKHTLYTLAEVCGVSIATIRWHIKKLTLQGKLVRHDGWSVTSQEAPQ